MKPADASANRGTSRVIRFPHSTDLQQKQSLFNFIQAVTLPFPNRRVTESKLPLMPNTPSVSPVPPKFAIVIPEETVVRSQEYLEQLQTGRLQPGVRLRGELKGSLVHSMSPMELLGKLVDTKSPQIFAETAVYGDGSDWNLTELGLLGDISIAIPVTVYDDGNHGSPGPHDPPFQGTLLFTPGALLRNGQHCTPADWNEVTTSDRHFSTEGYYNLYRRRLLPVLRYIDRHAGRPRSALVTVPGLGCGQFAGPYRGQLGDRLRAVLQRLLTEHGASLPNLKAVYFDPYSECQNARVEIEGISFMVRPLRQPGNERKSQLCRPTAYGEEGDDFSECSLYSLVAWDHVSWPGNDFFAGSRSTDDGVKAAASDSMFTLTGIEGAYNAGEGMYQPPRPYRDWEAVVQEGKLRRNLHLWNPAAVWRSTSSTPDF